MDGPVNWKDLKHSMLQLWFSFIWGGCPLMGGGVWGEHVCCAGAMHMEWPEEDIRCPDLSLPDSSEIESLPEPGPELAASKAQQSS